MSDTVMIVAGETSGELYGSLLAASLLRKKPSTRLIGIGGTHMREAGVELISGISSAFGLTEALSSLKSLRESFKKAVSALQNTRPSLLVLIDYPDFNLKLAGEAKKRNIKILYYVSPQVWAWRRGRVKKIASLVDRMAVILPFEEDVYKGTGLACEFVGHPVFDEIQDIAAGRPEIREQLGLEVEKPVLSLLPGSRPHELDRLFPVIADVVAECRRRFPDFQYCVPLAPNTDMNRYASIIDGLRQQGVVVSRGNSLLTLAASDYAVVASGTASLQAALLGTPMVVIYKLFPLTYWLGRVLVRVKHISLVNLLAGEGVVTELLQSNVTHQNIVRELERIMKDKPRREHMIKAYGNVREMFSGKRASDRVADMILEMTGWQ